MIQRTSLADLVLLIRSWSAINGHLLVLSYTSIAIAPRIGVLLSQFCHWRLYIFSAYYDGGFAR